MTPTLEDLCHLLISAHVTVGFGDPHPYPGCYLWVDDENRIAYVGTSEDVKARVAWEAPARPAARTSGSSLFFSFPSFLISDFENVSG